MPIYFHSKDTTIDWQCQRCLWLDHGLTTSAGLSIVVTVPTLFWQLSAYIWRSDVECCYSNLCNRTICHGPWLHPGVLTAWGQKAKDPAKEKGERPCTWREGGKESKGVEPESCFLAQLLSHQQTWLKLNRRQVLTKLPPPSPIGKGE